MRLLKPPFAEIKPESKIVCNGKDVMKMTDKELYKFRGDEISMIFQDPMTSLNPTMTISSIRIALLCLVTDFVTH